MKLTTTFRHEHYIVIESVVEFNEGRRYCRITSHVNGCIKHPNTSMSTPEQSQISCSPTEPEPQPQPEKILERKKSSIAIDN